MTTWNLADLKDTVRHKYGTEQEKLLIPPLNSVGQRGEFSKYHYLEARRLLEDATAANAGMEAMIVLFLGNDSASIAFQQARFKAAAHITACVQNMHATADTLAHAVYFALGMNLDPATCLEARYINIWKVKDKVPVRVIRDSLTEFVEHDGFRYLQALSNHSKHRSVVDIPFSVEVTAINAPPGLKFSKFKYANVEYPDRRVMPTLDAEYRRQSSLIVSIGQALSSPLVDLAPKPRRPCKPTQLQQGILYAAADLARYIVQVEDVAELLRRKGLADADCSDIDEMDKEQLRVLRDDFGLPLRGLD